jgi:putative ABC transport system ATP-binding protein
VIRTEKLTKIYNIGRPNEVMALKEASIEIAFGDFAIISGPSGSGKTTLLSLLGLLSRPTAGKIYYEDNEVSSYSDAWLTRLRKKQAGFVFQQFNLLPQFTAWENVSLPLVCRDTDKNERKKLAINLMRNLGLEKRVDFKVASLSVGEQQRVAIARSLITDPSILFADEPTASVDAEMALTILEIFTHLNKAGKTIVVATHDQSLMNVGTLFFEIQNGSIIKK